MVTNVCHTFYSPLEDPDFRLQRQLCTELNEFRKYFFMNDALSVLIKEWHQRFFNALEYAVDKQKILSAFIELLQDILKDPVLTQSHPLAAAAIAWLQLRGYYVSSHAASTNLRERVRRLREEFAEPTHEQVPAADLFAGIHVQIAAASQQEPLQVAAMAKNKSAEHSAERVKNLLQGVYDQVGAINQTIEAEQKNDQAKLDALAVQKNAWHARDAQLKERIKVINERLEHMEGGISQAERDTLRLEREIAKTREKINERDKEASGSLSGIVFTIVACAASAFVSYNFLPEGLNVIIYPHP